MIRPDDAAQLAKAVREMFVEAENALLGKIASALAKGLHEPDWAEKRLQATRHVLNQLDATIDALAAGAPGAVQRVLDFAYNRGIAAAGGDLLAAGAPEGVAFAEIQPTGAVTALAAATTVAGPQQVFQIRRAAADLYRDAVTRSTTLMAAGVVDRREATAKAVAQLAAAGLKAFTDQSGRRWDIGSYAEMAVRTSAAGAMLQGAHDRLRESGHDLVIVSDAPEECKLCRPWEGRVLSLTGGTEGTLQDGRVVAGSLDEARSAGLFHPNCRHSYSLYLPGVTKRAPAKADPEGDALRQQQRAYERRVRQLKRELAAVEPFGGAQAAAAKAKLRAKQSEFKAWREEHGRKNLAYRTSVA